MEKTNLTSYQLLYREFIKLHSSPNLHLIKRFEGHNTLVHFYLTETNSGHKGEDLFKVTVGLRHIDHTDFDPVLIGTTELLPFIQKEATQMVREYFTKMDDLRRLNRDDFFYLQLFIELEGKKEKQLVSTYSYTKGRWKPVFIPMP